MPRRHIEDTPTDSPYMWDDVVSYVLQEQVRKGIEMEDNSGYIMSESWSGSLDAGVPDEELPKDVFEARNELRMRRA